MVSAGEVFHHDSREPLWEDAGTEGGHWFPPLDLENPQEEDQGRVLETCVDRFCLPCSRFGKRVQLPLACNRTMGPSLTPLEMDMTTIQTLINQFLARPDLLQLLPYLVCFGVLAVVWRLLGLLAIRLRG